jgi:photosystem II stability/assembly factor-like uncharacterized protein
MADELMGQPAKNEEQAGSTAHVVSSSPRWIHAEERGKWRKWPLWVALGLGLLVYVLPVAYAIWWTGRPWIIGWQSAGVRWVVRTTNSLGAYELDAVYAAGDGKRLWTVGGTTQIPSGNVIGESSDGGKTWSAVKSGSATDELYGVFGTSDGRRLWAVGDQGTVVESDDGGKSWAARDSRTNADLKSISGTVDGKHLWAVGGMWYDPGGASDVGVIVESDDGGASWAAHRSSAPGILYSIFGTSDGRRLWAVGELGTMLESDDGGASWVVRRSGAALDALESIFGTSDGGQLWAVELHGKILKSSDGGGTWTERDTGLEPPPPLTVADNVQLSGGLASSNGKRVWLVGQIGEGECIFESDDGGLTWKSKYAEYMPLNAIAGTSDGKHLWAVGEGNTILESDSGW